MDLARDIGAGEKVEAELDNLIRRRGDRRREAEGHRPSEEMYEESVRRYNAQRERERCSEWANFHRQQAQRHRATLTDLIAHHQTQAAKYTDKNGHHNEEADQADD